MPTIIFVESNGTEHEVESGKASSIMEAAMFNGVPGIEAECGGCCICATCHVYIDEAAKHTFPPPKEDENGMLEFVSAEWRDASRLSCQLKIDDATDGLVVHLPDRQF